MQALALRPGDSAWAISSRFSFRYLGKLATGHKFELTFADRATFAVVTNKAVSVNTVWSNVPEQFVMQVASELRIGSDCITIRELSKGKIAVNYFGESSFVAIPLVDAQSAEAGSSIALR